MLDVRNPLAPIVVGNGLLITVNPGNLLLAGVPTNIASAVISLTQSATNYVHVTSSGIVSVNTTGFPASSLPIAQIVCSQTSITGVTDSRPDFSLPSSSGSSTSITSGIVGNALSSPKIISTNVMLKNMASGDTDVYTVPVGKKALVYDLVATNPQGTGVTISSFVEYKVSGVYTIYDQISGAGMTQGTYGTNVLLAPMLFNAGESFAINTNNVGLSVWVTILEFDSSVPLSVSRFTSFASGDNTIFTSPANGVILFPNIEGVGAGSPFKGCIWYFNKTGVSRTIGLNVVPSGDSVALANQFFAGVSVSANAISRKEYYGGMKTGDFININTDANTAGQTAWVIYQSLP